MTTDNLDAATHQTEAAETFPYRVLLGPPMTRTVPIFGLGANARRPDLEVWSISQKDESGRLDRQAQGRLRSRRFGDHCYLTIRHKTGPREARYASWLAFSEEENASAFQAEFPRYGLSNLLANAKRRIATIDHDLRCGLSKGRYDLGRIPEEMRFNKASLYVRLTTERRLMASNIQALHLLLLQRLYNV